MIDGYVQSIRWFERHFNASVAPLRVVSLSFPKLQRVDQSLDRRIGSLLLT